MTVAKRFIFDGIETDLSTMAKTYTAYGATWLAAAVRDGCTCLADLRQREAERMARQRKTQRNNGGPAFVIGRGR